MEQGLAISAASRFVVAFVTGVTPGKWSRTWQQRMPGTRLDLVSAPPGQAVAALTTGEVDMAFLRLPVDDALFASIPIYEEQPVAVMTNDHRLREQDAIAMADLVGVTALDADPEDWGSVIALAATGAGVCIVPHSVARALSRRDVIARPISDGTSSRVALVWPKSRDSELIQEFIGIVRGRTSNSSRGARPTQAPPPRAASSRTPRRPGYR